MRAHGLLFLALGSAALAGCLGGPTPAPQPEEPSFFVVGKALETRLEVPRRFSAELPSRAAAFDENPERYPPRSLVGALLCEGDAGMQRRFLDGFRRAVASDPGGLDDYRALLGYCSEGPKCEWLAGVLRSDAPLGLRRALWPALAQCRDRGYAKLLTHPAAPREVVIHWVLLHHDSLPRSAVPTSDAALARAAAAYATYGEEDYARGAGVALRRLEGADPVALVLAALELVPAGRRRHLLALGLSGLDAPEARRAVATACAALGEDGGWSCQPPEAREAPPQLAPVVARKAIRQSSRFVLGALERHGLIGAGEEPAADLAVPFSVADALVAYGRALPFDTWAGYPAEHDLLLRRLARLSEPLAEAVFEEIPPVDDDGDYLLRAYLDGFRYELKAAAVEEEYDLEAVLGLLNALMADRGGEERFAILAATNGGAVIVAAPAERLLAARAAGVLALVDPTAR